MMLKEIPEPLTDQVAARKLQNMFRSKRALHFIRQMVRNQYEKHVNMRSGKPVT